MVSLHDIAKENYSNDPVTKPLRYYEIFEQSLSEEGMSPRCILEIGVYQGESTKALSRRFPDALIVALDLNLRDIDFSGCGNVRYLQCDQADGTRLKSICEEYFPDGLDLVIEDASHIGHLSRLTFDSVFPHLRHGGLYIVEDWGTGYWDTWIDGRAYADRKLPGSTRRIARRVPSHDFGMVGFVKSLVDCTAADDITDKRARAGNWLSRIAMQAARLGIVRKVVDRMPQLRSWLVRSVGKPAQAGGVPDAATGTPLPRLKSLRVFKGVCVACKE